jgi:UDP-N-acetylmuramate dehydrogenase
MFSDIHANFLVNTGGGTYEDALWLIKEAQKRVSEQFDIALQCEVVILRDETVTK